MIYGFVPLFILLTSCCLPPGSRSIFQDPLRTTARSFSNLLHAGKGSPPTEHHHVSGLTSHTRVTRPRSFCRHLSGGRISWNLLLAGKGFPPTEHHHVSRLTSHTRVTRPRSFCRHLNGGRLSWITPGRPHPTASSRAESPDYFTRSPE